MRDVYLWIGLGVVAVSAWVLIVAITRRLFDRQRERRYVPPSVLYTEVWPRNLPPARALPEPEVKPTLMPAWGLALLADFVAQETKIQRAIAGEVTSAPIWADIHGRRHVQGLAVA